MKTEHMTALRIVDINRYQRCVMPQVCNTKTTKIEVDALVQKLWLKHNPLSMVYLQDIT